MAQVSRMHTPIQHIYNTSHTALTTSGGFRQPRWRRPASTVASQPAALFIETDAVSMAMGATGAWKFSPHLYI